MSGKSIDCPERKSVPRGQEPERWVRVVKSSAAGDLATQASREFERQRGWFRAADGYFGPAPIPLERVAAE
jgi:hypothetical protein